MMVLISGFLIEIAEVIRLTSKVDYLSQSAWTDRTYNV